MIIQTGARTDIPAFYSEWFANRIREGYVLTRNPYDLSRVTRYSLSPEVVDAIAFCTKNPSPMFSRMDLLAPYGQYWFVTITGYGKDIEPNVPDKEKVMDDFIQLSEMIGRNCVGWRYDPVLIHGKYTVEYHIRTFEHYCERLHGYTDTCVISFVDLYKKVEKNFPGITAVTDSERTELAKAFSGIASSYGITVKGCAEGSEMTFWGIDCSGCMTKETFEKAIGIPLDVPGKEHSPRQICGCLLGRDIGMYNTCGHLCRYCYANSDPKAVAGNMRRHDPASPFLIGDMMPGDIIHDAEQKSWKQLQFRLI